jgi:hypothetical protein
VKTSFAGFLTAIGTMIAAQAQDVGLWQFNGNLNSANGGDPITELFVSGEFGTTESFAIGAINGEVAQVLKFPAVAEEDTGFVMPVSSDMADPNQYSFMADVYYPAASNSSGRGLGDTSPDFGGAEISINGNNALAAGGSSGVINPDTWHRVIVTIDGANQLISRYVDGRLTGTSPISADELPFGRYTLDPQLDVILFGFTTEGYVNSAQLRDEVISSGQAIALGGATADGLPEELPPVPSFVDSWTPSGNVANRDTDIGVVLNQGDSTIDQDSIVFSLDGEVQTPAINQSGDEITLFVDRDLPFSPGSKHTLEVTYTDDKDGGQTATHNFDAAIYFEDFEGLALGPNVDEGLEFDKAWTREGPEGWDVDDSGIPGVGDPDNDGVTEWAGWSFADRDWWIATAGDQRRSEFNLAQGTVMVADPDEWDDTAHADSEENGWYKTFVTTPPISLEGIAENSAFLQFASSWRDEFDSNYRQTANIEMSVDGGDFVEILRWESDPASPNFKDDVPNETVLLDLNNAAGTKEVVFKFGLFDAGNDWWWAIDNLVVNAGVKPPVLVSSPSGLEVDAGGAASFSVTVEGTGPFTYEWFFNGDSIATEQSNDTTNTLTVTGVTPESGGNYHVVVSNDGGSTPPSSAALLEVRAAVEGAVLFAEDFEGLPLGPNVDEALAGDEVWTDTLPDGWSRVNDLPGLDDDEVGVREWEGWAFADRAWWAATAGDQRRTEFVKGTGTIAIADGDEWDDKGSPAGQGTMNTLMTTSEISIAGVKEGTLTLRFNSSWRPEVLQTGLVEASFDGGAPIEVLRFSSEAGEDFKDHAPNDTVTVNIDHPADASSMTLTFSYLEAGNNWWWAIDNIEVKGVLPPLFFEDFEGLALGANVDEGVAGDNVWTPDGPADWMIDSDLPGLDDPEIGVREWEGWAFADRAWWAETAGDQRRTEFLKGVGTVAIADGDEWDDKGDPDSLGFMNTWLSTPAIAIDDAILSNSLLLRYSSSWRPENDQKAVVKATYTLGDGSTKEVEVQRWTSRSEEVTFHDHETNESVSVDLWNPEGAQSVVVSFGYLDAKNNWWWAIDNIEVLAGAQKNAPAAAASISISAIDGQVSIEWEGSALESAASVLGPWTPVDGASSPHTVDADQGQAYFRAR